MRHEPRQVPRSQALLLLWFSAAVLVGCSMAPTSPTLDELVDRNAGFESATVLYVHGAGDTTARWAQALVVARGGFAFDWKEDATDRLAAPALGYALGQSLAPKLTNLAGRRLYAHSAGAWVAQGIADGLAEIPGAFLPTIVFLDPFTALSLFDWGAGGAKLGKNTAQVETYFTTRDPIPFTGGDVAAGNSTNLDDVLDPAIVGTPAHWAVIDWYFANH